VFLLLAVYDTGTTSNELLKLKAHHLHEDSLWFPHCALWSSFFSGYVETLTGDEVYVSRILEYVMVGL
jgi:hypothetical protein